MRRSLMLQVLLPVGALLIVLITCAVTLVAFKDRDAARSALSAKASLTAGIAASGAAEAVWNIDGDAAQASLHALSADPDYVGSELTDDHGKTIVSDGAKAASSGAIIIENVPVVRTEHDQAKTIGTLELRMSTARADTTIAEGTLLLSAVGAGALIVVCGLLFLIIQRATSPIIALTRSMTQLSAGTLDAAIPALDRSDEVGRMARAVEVFKQNAIERVRMAEENRQQEARAAAEKHSALIAMAETIEAEAGSAMDSVAARTDDIAATAEAMSASATRTGQSARGAAAAASDALANAQTVTEAAEQLSSAIREISRQVSHSSEVVGRAVSAGTDTRATMSTLNEQVGRIGNVADMISDIAAKTNLLALNATIEAARAGDAGKGFAVVASEVKALASQTARSTQEIAQHIEQVRGATDASVTAVGRIEETIAELNAIAGSIAAAVEQQAASTAQIARNVGQTAAAANEMTSRIGEVSTEAERTGGHSSKVRDDTAALVRMFGDLKHSLVRIVRSSTSEAERRGEPLTTADLACQVTVAGTAPFAARVINISPLGAAIQTNATLDRGARGHLKMHQLGTDLPFAVRGAAGDMVDVTFDLDAATAERLTQELGRLGLRLAA
jgi:methyl-accepting chemotaxis protein